MTKRNLKIIWSFLVILTVIWSLPLAFCELEQIMIFEDGTIYPDNSILKEIDEVFYLVRNVSSKTIVIEKSGIIFDGDGYTIQGDGSTDSAGVKIFNVRDVTIRNINIRGYDNGIQLITAKNNVLFNNSFSENHFALYFDRESGGNEIYLNNFIDDEVRIASSNTWSNEEYGNYWSQYDKEDIFSGPYQSFEGSDGIADRPHYIDEYNIDLFPLMTEIGLIKQLDPDDIIVPTPTFEVIIIVSGNGNTDPLPGIHVFDENVTVNIEAFPEEGWKFEKWLLDDTEVNRNSTYQAFIDSEKKITCVFVKMTTRDVLDLRILGIGIIAFLIISVYGLISTLNNDRNNNPKS